MDLQSYTMEQVFQAAIKSEKESTKVYADLAAMVRNVFLKEKLMFLSSEEEKHRTLLEGEFEKHLPGKECVLPETSPVPLPELVVPDESIPLTEVIDSAMKAELAAKDFYLSMKEFFKDDDEINPMLDYFASMEMGHYQMLSIERENIAQFEDYDSYWEMMNIGP